MNTTTVTCPRCLGFDNAFTRFGHIAHGKCLRCMGSKTVEIATWKLEERTAATAATLAKAKAEMMARPYIVAVDGMECIGSMFETWEAANDWKNRLGCNDYGDAFRVAKWDGECHRYRSGVKVRFHNN
jgi:hypothetical protein